MKLEELLESKSVVGYHRTWKLENVKSILKDGFKVQHHTNQVFFTATWESANSLDGKTGGDYGKFLIRCKIDTSNFPKTGKFEKNTGDGDLILVTDPSIISDIEYTVLDLDDSKYWVDGEVGFKFIKDFPRPEDLKWKKK